MRFIGYNAQDNNTDPTKGKLPGWKQCFGTSAWMFLSYFAPSFYKWDDDAGLSKLIEDLIEGGVDQEFEWSVQRDHIQKWLDKAGVKGTVKCLVNLKSGDGLCDWDQLKEILKKGPAIIGTYKLGGLPGGHIILAVCLKDDGTIGIFNDPFGNAKTNYKDKNGGSVEYTQEFLTPEALYGGRLRVIHFEPAA